MESGKKKWFALKDKKLRCRAKGSNPQILLQFNLHWNVARAAMRTLNPKDERYLQTVERFKRAVFLNNVMRIRNIIMEFVALGKFVESCLEWENPLQSTVAFAGFLASTYYFQPFMAPLALLLIFLKNYLVRSYLPQTGLQLSDGGDSAMGLAASSMEEDEEVDEDKEEKKTLKAKLQAVQDVTATVQNALGYVASLAEKVKNTFNFSVPFLSWLAIMVLAAVAVVLYYVSPRLMIMLWGVNKFTKKLIRPNYVPNNELLDFLSRVPDNEDLVDSKELKLSGDDQPTQISPSIKKGQGGVKKKTKQS